MAIDYKIVTIEDFKDDASSVAALDAEGANDWELVQVSYSTQVDSSQTATCIFKK
jgi:hypothetical protein